MGFNIPGTYNRSWVVHGLYTKNSSSEFHYSSPYIFLYLSLFSSVFLLFVWLNVYVGVTLWDKSQFQILLKVSNTSFCFYYYPILTVLNVRFSMFFTGKRPEAKGVNLCFLNPTKDSKGGWSDLVHVVCNLGYRVGCAIEIQTSHVSCSKTSPDHCLPTPISNWADVLSLDTFTCVDLWSWCTWTTPLTDRRNLTGVVPLRSVKFFLPTMAAVSRDRVWATRHGCRNTRHDVFQTRLTASPGPVSGRPRTSFRINPTQYTFTRRCIKKGKDSVTITNNLVTEVKGRT